MKTNRLTLCLCAGWMLCGLGIGATHDSELYRLPVPPGLDLFVPVPDDNPPTREKAELGRQLFFDKRLSRDGTVACATCHIPEHAFSDGRRVAVGIESRVGRRNVPTLLNRAYGRTLFWDGRAKALEKQPLQAILNPKEMDLTREELETRLNELKELSGLHEGKSYREHFEEVFGTERSAGEAAEPVSPGESAAGATRYEVGRTSRSAATPENAAKAIASFVRTLLSGNSAFDRFELGDANALSDAAKRGLQILRGKANCIACHSGPLMSDEDFHNTGVSWGKEPLDLESTRRHRSAARSSIVGAAGQN